MPNHDNLNVLRRGVLAWNSWRARRKRFDLSWADLSDVCCDRARFAGADVNQMLIIGASMCGTFFRDLKGCPIGVGEGPSSITANPNATVVWEPAH